MKTLIWKEIREFRFHLLLMMAFGLGSVAILSYNNMLDRDTLTTLLLVFANPIFILLFSQYIVAGEVSSGTFPFLAGLPVSRARLWLGKLLSVILLAAALTGFFTALVMIVGETSFTHYLTFMRTLPPLSPLFLLVGFPLAMIALGFFATMLPGAPTVAVLTGTVLVFISVFLSHSLKTINFTLFLPLLIASFLTASYQAFKRGELLQGWKPVVTGWVTLLGCIFVSIAIWTGFDTVADIMPDQGKLKIVHLGHSFKEGSYAPYVRAESSWWNPINDRFTHWTVTLDPIKGRLTRIGPRCSQGGLVSPDGTVMALVSTYRAPGYLGAPRLLLVDMKSGETLDTIDTNAEPIAFMPDGSLIYTRRIETTQADAFGYVAGKPLPDISELCRYRQGARPKVIGSWSASYLSPQILAGRNQAIIHTADFGMGIDSEFAGKGILLVDLENGKSTKVLASQGLSLIYEGKGKAVFRQGYRWDSSSDTYAELTASGALLPLTWIPSETVILERHADKPLAWIHQRGNWDDVAKEFSFARDAIAQLDFEAGTCTILYEDMTAQINKVFRPHPDDTWLLVATEEGKRRFNRRTGTMEPLNLPIRFTYDVSVLGGDRYLVLADPKPYEEISRQTLWTLDLAKAEATQL